MRYLLAAFGAVLSISGGMAQGIQQTKGEFDDKFRQLDEVLPSPNIYRNAAGEPGHEYWQQEADYTIRVSLDEPARRISAAQTVTYKNNSPDTLRYLWLQLDQNRFREDSIAEMTRTFTAKEPGSVNARMALKPQIRLSSLRRMQSQADHDYGYDITRVADARGNALANTIVGTLMRIDLPRPLAPGQSTSFQIDWEYNLVEQKAMGGRAGYEHFPDDLREGGNDIFLVAQWFPRMVAYSDYEGWHNKEFLGSGEFTLEFGDYDVEITVPNDHVVSSTGVLQNPRQVLTSQQRARLDRARNADRPVFVITPEEAESNESSNPDRRENLAL